MSTTPSHDRTGIYYWKCDRAAAFHGTEAERPSNPLFEEQLRHAIQQRFPSTPLDLRPADGQGNHRTFRLTLGGQEAFVRTEDGPEGDNYFAVESVVADALHAMGLPVPQVIACDCSRSDTSFAWQILEYVPQPDLNQHFKQGTLAVAPVAEAIGEAVARWQEVQPPGFGPFSATEASQSRTLRGLHSTYSAYYFLNLRKHVSYLHEQGFFALAQAEQVLETVARNLHLLCLDHGCLVHKDLALWNILGSPDRIAAFIDWDDAISGDPMDDLSLLACFHGRTVIERALAGYARVRPLPDRHLPRFWLCLLRNMLVKAVIRVGAGYFKRNDSFFLIGAGSTGADLESLTRQRIEVALHGLNAGGDLSILP